MESFFEKLTGKNLEDFDIHIISVGGTSFKRYLDIAKLLGIKTAVIRDNDGNFQLKCVERYKDYAVDNVQIFYNNNNCQSTFEISVYQLNIDICEELFGADRKTLTVQDFMLNNKADVALELLDKKIKAIEIPEYIKNAIKWIKN